MLQPLTIDSKRPHAPRVVGPERLPADPRAGARLAVLVKVGIAIMTLVNGATRPIEIQPPPLLVEIDTVTFVVPAANPP